MITPGQPFPSHQSSTRSARSVFQRLGAPTPSSRSKWTRPGWMRSSSHRPSGCRLRPHDLDGLGHPRVRVGARRPEVVERAQHVVVPVVRERELEVRRIDDLAGALAAEQAALEQVLLAAAPRLADRRRTRRSRARTRAARRAR